MEKLYHDYKPIWHCHNKSGKLGHITHEVRKHLKTYKYHIDKYGNIFIGNFSKSRPCLVAHLDSVHSKKSKKFSCKNGVLRSNKGIGGDDKCGVIAILEILKMNKNINAILTSDEEIGGIGAGKISFNILENVKYFIEIDRADNNDIIFESGMNLIASEEFQKALEPFTEKYGYREDFGTFTDVNILTETSRKCAINVSCGYYNPHTVNEYVKLKDLQRTIRFVLDIVNNISDTFTWKKKEYLDYNVLECDSLEDIITEAYLDGGNEYTIDLIIQAYKIGVREREGKKIEQWIN